MAVASQEQDLVSVSTKEIPAKPLEAPLQANKENQNPDLLHFICLALLKGPPTADLTFFNLSYNTPGVPWWWRTGSKTLLKNLSGRFKGGELTAIMGPSGAETSALMNILAGYRSVDVKGQILVNGKPRNLKTFRKMSCYIMQHDILLPHLTVKEAMMFSANLKLKEKVEGKEELVDDILTKLGLKECVQTRTKCLSGGQRKRLAIALELVTNPPIMFLDKPTSGLDSASRFQVVSLLKSLAQAGRTIICTIHQPSAKLFEIFDKLYIISQAQCIYKGTVPNLVPYLRKLGLDCPTYHNPADFIIEVASGDYGDVNQVLSDAAQAALPPEENEKNPRDETTSTRELQDTGPLGEDGFAASTFTQLRLLFKRAFLSEFRDSMMLSFSFMLHLFNAVVFGMAYLQMGNDVGRVFDYTALLFLALLLLMFSALMVAILTFPLEMPVLQSECLNSWYSLKAYYLARTVIDVPFQVIFSVVYCAIVNWMTEQPLELSRNLPFIAFFTSATLAAQSLGLLIGAAAPSLQVATFAGPFAAIPVLLYMASFIKFVNILNFPHGFSYISYGRYGFETGILFVYSMNRSELECPGPACLFKEREKALELSNMEDAQLHVDLCVLAFFFFFYRVVAYFVLHCKVKSER